MRLLMIGGLPIALTLLMVAVLIVAVLKARFREQAGALLLSGRRGLMVTLVEAIYLVSPGVLLLAAVSLAAAGFMFKVAAYSPLRGLLASRSWVATPCTILQSGLESHPDSDGQTVSRLALRYTYDVGGRSFEGTRYDFGFEGFSTGEERKLRTAATLPSGTRTTCLVDPQQPERSVISRAVDGDLLSILWGCAVFGGAGVGLLAWSVIRARKARRALQ